MPKAPDHNKVKAENARVEAVKKDLQAGMLRAGIIAKYGKKWQNVSARTYDRYISAAKEIIDREAREMEAELQKAKSAALEVKKSEILTELEIDIVLSKIVKGEHETVKVVYDGSTKGFKSIKEKPSHQHIIAAAQELYKRKGAYPKDKTPIDVRLLDGYVLGGDSNESDTTDTNR